jgi:hypothetical protein
MAALTFSQFYPNSSAHAGRSETQAVLSNLLLFNRSLAVGKLGQAWSKLWGRSSGLLDLEEVQSQASITNSRYAGTRSVSIDRIQGSQGRSADFDAHFHPLHERTQDRWMSILAAMQNGVILPPVELVQVGERYFVRDGHHRISVARALGQIDVDAEVTALDLNDL